MKNVARSPEEIHRLNVLRDLYENLLPERQREVIRLKFDEDLSLTEIAERLGVSRQACEDALQRGIKALTEFEEKIGFHAYREKVAAALSRAEKMLSQAEEVSWDEARQKLLQLLRGVISGGEEHGI